MALVVKVMTNNGRKDNIKEDQARKNWDGSRDEVMMGHLKKINPDVWGGQEWTVNMCNDVMETFPHWSYAGGVKYGNCPIFWNTDKFSPEPDTLLEKRYPSDARERYMTLIRLQSRSEHRGFWFGSMHLAVESSEERNSARLRAAQMTAIIKDTQAWIAAHPHPEDGKANLIFVGDLNDNLGDYGGVRKIAYDKGGWKGLRRRLKDQGDTKLVKFVGDTYRTTNHWDHTSELPRDSKAIDEIFTSGVSVAGAWIERTCLDIYKICASDHNDYAATVNV